MSCTAISFVILNIYHGHVNTLNHIGEKQEGAYHTMMAYIHSSAR
jgi:hypothetical protein